MTRTTTLWSLLLLSAALALGSCTKDATEQATGPEPEAKAASKLVFSSANAVRGELLVCFGEEAVAGIESSVMQVTRSGGVATRSGIADFDAVLGSIGVKALQRLFPVDERNEEPPVCTAGTLWSSTPPPISTRRPSTWPGSPK